MRSRSRDHGGTILVGLTLILIITVIHKVKADADLHQHFLASVDKVLQDLVIDAFWTQGRFYNMTSTANANSMFSLFYGRPEAAMMMKMSAEPEDTTDPTGVYSKSKRELPTIYQSAPPAVPCKNAASTSIVSGSKAVDFAAFTIGIMTLVININNNINNNNNNDNNLNLNAVDSSNIVANFNTNNANQVNIQPPGGRKKRTTIGSSAHMIVSAIKAVMDRIDGQLVPNLRANVRNDSIMARIQHLIVNQMMSNPRSKIMAGCSDIDNCSQRLSFLI